LVTGTDEIQTHVGTALAVRSAHSSSRSTYVLVKKSRGPPGSTDPLVLKKLRRSRNKRLFSIDASAQKLHHTGLFVLSFFFDIPGCPDFCGQHLTCIDCGSSTPQFVSGTDKRRKRRVLSDYASERHSTPKLKTQLLDTRHFSWHPGVPQDIRVWSTSS